MFTTTTLLGDDSDICTAKAPKELQQALCFFLHGDRSRMLGETLPANWVKTPTGTLNLATLHFRTGWLKG
ncbi:hypothetical protein SBA2_130010 [Acidobacteriia bacterium SbA2]|nr:hypothetical protein SBA2_130010 [Acidobacteriia bacterium SbA2]